MSLFCAICIEEYTDNKNDINIFNERYTLQLLHQIVDAKEIDSNVLSNKFIRLECSHIYHIMCLLKSFEYNTCYCNKCPMCRQFINMEFMVYIKNLYIKILEKQIQIFRKIILKNKMKMLVYKVLIIKEESNKIKSKLNDIIGIENHYTLLKSNLEKTVEKLLVVSHKPCRMAIDIYMR